MFKQRIKNATMQIEASFSLLRVFIAILIALAVAFVLIYTVSENPIKDFMTLLTGPLSTTSRMVTIISKAIPLLFTGTAISIIYSCGQINIAAEGGFFFGAVISTVVAIQPGIPSYIHVPLCLLAGAIGGAVVVGIPGILHVRYGVVTIVSSLMMNYVALFSGLYIILNPLRDPLAGFEASFPFAQSAIIPAVFGDSRIHLGLYIGIAVVIFGYVLVYKTPFGQSIRTVGKNQQFSVYSGMPVGKTIILSSLIAGALSGMGGGVETLGNYQRFVYTGFTNHGWDGILLAVLCKNNPKYIPIAALFLAYIRTSADALNFSSKIPPEIISVIQAVIIIFVAAERFLSGWELKAIVKRSKSDMKKEA